ncbi:MAG: acetylxylan esterase [Chitinophagaceae bacterium]|nr:acetylxylan esterase [Chitinophagaceae bacterium]
MLSVFVTGNVTAQPIPYAVDPVSDQPNNIRHHLVRCASNISNNFFSNIITEQWLTQTDTRKQQLAEMLGLVNVPLQGERTPLHVKKTGVIQQKGYRIEKLYYESLPQLYVPGNLYIPNNIRKPVPAILYLCGHAPEQKVFYQARAQKFAQLGFVCLIIETIQFGEVRGEHGGTNTNGWFNWYSRGYNPGGVEVWNGIRALDLLSQLPEVDKNKLGVTGASGGGAQSWYLAALDARVKAVAPVAGAGTLDMQIAHRTVDAHCDCMMSLNVYQFDYADIGALIAPRPLLIANANRDDLYSIESIRKLKTNIQKVYSLFNAENNISLVEAPGGHADRSLLRPKIAAFFLKHLMGKEVNPDLIGDFDTATTKLLSDSVLRVFVNGPIKNDRTTSIQNSFIQLASPPVIKDVNDLSVYRNQVLDFLKAKTFHAFPVEATALNTQWEFRYKEEAKFESRVYSFIPEKDWRLKVKIHWNQSPEQPQPLLLVLRNPNEERNAAEELITGVDPNISIAFFKARGIGETGWSPDLQWHIRRASAWTGRTVASMRVYDVLRCLEMLRTLGGCDKNRISIAASGEMAAVALYAALLDGNIHSIIIKDPPASQDIASEKNGRGEAIEMLNCLQVTDLAQVAGIISLKNFIALGKLPTTYQWTENTLKKIRHAQFIQMENLKGWNPNQ